MKKVFILALLGILSLSLLTGAMAETAAPVAETAVTAKAPALDATELDALLALNLENGKTFSAALEELGILDTFKTALPRVQLQMIHAQLLLGKLTQADVTLLRDTLVKAVFGDVTAAGFMNGRNFSNGMGRFNRGGRNNRQSGKQGGMMRGKFGMMQPGQGRGPIQGGALCPNCPNCPNAEVTPETTPETVNP
jgi:hypothetical protein